MRSDTDKDAWRRDIEDTHRRLNSGEDPEQVHIPSAKKIQFSNIVYSELGTVARATLHLDRHEVPDVLLWRDQAGKAVVHPGLIPHRMRSYSKYFLGDDIWARCTVLADELLAKVKPFGRDPQTGREITASTPIAERIVDGHR